MCALKMICMFFFLLLASDSFFFYSFHLWFMLMLFEQSVWFAMSNYSIHLHAQGKIREKKKGFEQIENELEWTWNSNEPFETDYDPILSSNPTRLKWFKHITTDPFIHTIKTTSQVYCLCDLIPICSKRFTSYRSIDCSFSAMHSISIHLNRTWFYHKKKKKNYSPSKTYCDLDSITSQFCTAESIYLHRWKSIKNVKHKS